MGTETTSSPDRRPRFVLRRGGFSSRRLMIVSLMPADVMSRYRRPKFPVFTNHKNRRYFFQTPEPVTLKTPSSPVTRNIPDNIDKIRRVHELGRFSRFQVRPNTTATAE